MDYYRWLTNAQTNKQQRIISKIDILDHETQWMNQLYEPFQNYALLWLRWLTDMTDQWRQTDAFLKIDEAGLCVYGVYSCTWRDKTCKPIHITKEYTDMGLCYTINWNASNALYAKATGKLSCWVSDLVIVGLGSLVDSRYSTLPRPFTPGLKFNSSTNPFLHSLSGSFWTASRILTCTIPN